MKKNKLNMMLRMEEEDDDGGKMRKEVWLL